MSRKVNTIRLALATSILGATVGSLSTSQASAPFQTGSKLSQVMEPSLAASLAAASSDESIVVFVHSKTIDDAVRATRSAGLRLVEQWRRVGIAVAAGLPSAIRRVAGDPLVRHVEANTPVAPFLSTAHIATRAEEARTPTTGLLTPEHLAYDGTGITIAVVDSGIDGTNPMFVQDGVSKVVRNLHHACVDPDPCDEWLDAAFNDDDGHGTAVAGVAAGYERRTLNGRSVRGVASGAQLVGLGSDAYLQIYGHLSGMNWVLEHHADPCGDGSCPAIRVESNSWGPFLGEGERFDPESAIAKLSDALVADGIVVTFAISNNGGDGSVNAVGVFANNPTPGVIGVANYSDAGSGSRDNGLSDDSARGLRSDPATYPDLAAPGDAITTSCTAVLPRCHPNVQVDPYYSILSGTSFSSPYVAGVAALLFQADPSLTPSDVEHIVEGTAYKFGAADYVVDPQSPDQTTSFDRGHGLVDVTAALATALGKGVPALQCDGSLHDPQGDANNMSLIEGAPQAASEDTLDITGARVHTDPGSGALTFSVSIADLGNLPPAGGISENIQFRFTYRDIAYELQMERHGGSAELATQFLLQRGGSVIDREIVAEGLHGVFDVDGDRVTVTVPANVFNAWDPNLPVIEDGDKLVGLWLASNRSYGFASTLAAFVTADFASDHCPYIVGS